MIRIFSISRVNHFMNTADEIYELIFKDIPIDERHVVECGLRPIKKTKWTDEMVIDLVKIVSDELIQEMFGQTKGEFLKECLINK